MLHDLPFLLYKIVSQIHCKQIKVNKVTLKKENPMLFFCHWSSVLVCFFFILFFPCFGYKYDSPLLFFKLLLYYMIFFDR
jgi:hypothetical protein